MRKKNNPREELDITDSINQWSHDLNKIIIKANKISMITDQVHTMMPPKGITNHKSGIDQQSILPRKKWLIFN